jgi:ribosomal protein L37E
VTHRASEAVPHACETCGKSREYIGKKRWRCDNYDCAGPIDVIAPAPTEPRSETPRVPVKCRRCSEYATSYGACNHCGFINDQDPRVEQRSNEAQPAPTFTVGDDVVILGRVIETDDDPEPTIEVEFSALGSKKFHLWFKASELAHRRESPMGKPPPEEWQRLIEENTKLRTALSQIEKYELGRDAAVNSTYSMCVAGAALRPSRERTSEGVGAFAGERKNEPALSLADRGSEESASFGNPDPVVTVEKVRDWAISKPVDSRWWECGLCGEIWPEDGSDEHHEPGCPAHFDDALRHASPCAECGGTGETEEDATGALGYVVKRACPRGCARPCASTETKGTNDGTGQECDDSAERPAGETLRGGGPLGDRDERGSALRGGRLEAGGDPHRGDPQADRHVTAPSSGGSSDRRKAEDFMCRVHATHMGSGDDDLVAELAALLAEVRAEEREACAKLCDDLYDLRTKYAKHAEKAGDFFSRRIEEFAAFAAKTIADRIRKRSTHAMAQEKKR